jgi:Uma2 family endonuclease
MAIQLTGQAVLYPESDGNPIAENTLQFEWIEKIKGNLEALFADNPDVFVAGDLLWYPVEGDNRTRTAPDVMVAFGRPKGYRGAYLQWQESNLPPQVVFEILSPGNRAGEMVEKWRFFERHGVEEYYLYNPHNNEFAGWQRSSPSETLEQIDAAAGWTSPRLGVRFDVSGPELILYRPDGEAFKSFVELRADRDRAEQERDAEKARADRLAERLRELGIDPETV